MVRCYLEAREEWQQENFQPTIAKEQREKVSAETMLSLSGRSWSPRRDAPKSRVEWEEVPTCPLYLHQSPGRASQTQQEDTDLRAKV